LVVLLAVLLPLATLVLSSVLVGTMFSVAAVAASSSSFIVVGVVRSFGIVAAVTIGVSA